MRKPQGSAHLRTVFDQPYVSAAQPYVTTCLLAVGLTPVLLENEKSVAPPLPTKQKSIAPPFLKFHNRDFCNKKL